MEHAGRYLAFKLPLDLRAQVFELVEALTQQPRDRVCVRLRLRV